MRFKTHGIGDKILFVGVLMLICCLFFAWREYAVYLGREMREITELLAFVKHIRERMSCYLEPISAWIGEYSTPELERLGFLGALRGGMDVKQAFADCLDKMCISPDVSDAFSDTLTEMGDAYLESELDTLDSAVDKLSTAQKRVNDDYKNKIKASGAMLAAVAIGVVVLFI